VLHERVLVRLIEIVVNIDSPNIRAEVPLTPLKDW